MWPMPKRQAGLGAFERLALALLVAAQDQRPVRRVEIKADHIPEFGLELRIAGQLEGPHQMRLDVVGAPQPLHRGLRDARRLGHRAYAPALSVWRRLRRPAEDLALGGERDRRLPTASLGIG